MNQIIVKQILSDTEIKQLEGNFVNETHIEHLITKDTIIVNEKNDLVAVLIKNAVNKNILDSCRTSFRKASKRSSNNRGMASGNLETIYKVGDKIGDRVIGKIDGFRYTPINIKNGKLSNTSYALTVNSSTVGFSDRYPRIPYCRTTTFTQKNLLEYKKMIPYILKVNEIYNKFANKQYIKQKKLAELTNQDFIIKDTAFTTVTVNRNFRTACHYDKGDYKNGMGNLGVLSIGNYKGGVTVIPKYGLGLDVRDGDIALFDVHELHGNTKLEKRGYAERISIVCYFREKMLYCGNSDYELKRAKSNTKTMFTKEEKDKADKILKEIDG